MIWYANAPRTTSLEYERMDHIRSLGCMCCALKGDTSPRLVEIHHIIRGNKRLGHWYTIPLCAAHHRGERGVTGTKEISVHGSGMKEFRRAYGYDDLQLWQKLQVMLGLDDSLPPTKVFKRKAPHTEAEQLTTTIGE